MWLSVWERKAHSGYCVYSLYFDFVVFIYVSLEFLGRDFDSDRIS